jgi:hypothetical protein
MLESYGVDLQYTGPSFEQPQSAYTRNSRSLGD